jgi:N-acetylglucosamine-6-sulfatase
MRTCRLVLAIAAGLCSGVEAGRPNILFILIDDMGWMDLGCQGNPNLHTPHVDAFASQGLRFTDAYAPAPVCSPTRAAIMTGQSPARLHITNHLPHQDRFTPEDSELLPAEMLDHLPLEHVTIAERLRDDGGYATAFIGKWHMGGETDEPRPGFDHWVSFRGQGNYLPPSPDYTLNVDGRRVKQKGYITDELTDYAVDWLDKQEPAEKPFFLYLSHKAVHANFTPAERHEGKLAELPFTRPASEANTEENYRGKPRWLRDQRNSWHGVDFPYHSELAIEEYYKRYCETLMGVDDSIGRVMAQLKKMGIYEETLVIYMGDNGFMFGEHGLIDKRVAYETSIRVPMLMQCPELFKGGTVVEQVAANIDIAPTVMEAMALEKPPHMDGQSFLRLAQGEKIPWRDYFLYVYYWEKNFPQSPTVFSLRGDRYKYITYYGLWDADELYDLQSDPKETTNLLYQENYADIAGQMQDRLYEMMDELGGLEIPLNPPRGNSQNKRLRGRGGKKAGDFPEALVVDAPANRNAQ